MAIASNADDYTLGRLNYFFPGIVPSLDGQCVSLVKWFMQEMSSVPSPQAARGDARYVGQTLVRQGHAIEVPYTQRRRGDIICYEYGTYGHIAVQLSGGRVFEQNVNIVGPASKIVDGARVYASRIGSENESFRRDAHVYRLKTYVEGGADYEMITKDDIGLLRIGHSEIGGWDLHRTHAGEYDALFLAAWQGKPVKDFVWAQWDVGGPYRDAKEALKRRVAELEQAIGGSKAEVMAAQKAVADANAKVAEESAKATEAGKRLLEIEAQRKADEATGNSFLRWLGNQLNKLIGRV